MIIGFVNILAGIITTIQQFLKISELNETHELTVFLGINFIEELKLNCLNHHLKDKIYMILKHVPKNSIGLWKQSYHR